jgi:nicotinamidase-related amidase
VPSISEIIKNNEDAVEFEKKAFSMFGDKQITLAFEMKATSRKTKDVFLYGIFTEACILKTTMNLINKGFKVWLVQEGISSINNLDMIVAYAVKYHHSFFNP